MITTNTQFEAELKKLIVDEIERIKENLAQGLAITDHAEYKYHTGQIFALHRVINDYCDEANTIISTR